MNEALRSGGFEGQAKIVTLDAMPTGGRADLSLSLGCVAGVGVAYLTPYSYVIPPSADTYAVGIWDEKADGWVQSSLGWYKNPVLTDDGGAIYATNQAQLRQIIRILEEADRNRDPDLVLNVGIFDSKNDDVRGLWGEFDPAGLQNALQYLPCF